MTTRDFIRKEFQVNRERHCSSVHNVDGNIFSYGIHYPLLFTVAGLTFRNVRGYSASTAKHVGWAAGIADYDVLWPYDQRLHWHSDAKNLEIIDQALTDKLVELQMELFKKRDGTQIHQHLLTEFNRFRLSQLAVRDRLRALRDETNMVEPATERSAQPHVK